MADQNQHLPVSQLQPNPLQPRGVIAPETIIDLVDSIREHGILEPLVVAHTPAGYQIIAGERRWRAAKMAGLETVPCVIKETSPQNMLEMAIVENVQREDLNALERAEAFNRLAYEFKLSHADIAKRVSKSPSYVSNSIKLLDLPDALKDGILSGVISEGHARALQAIKDKSKMIEAYKLILKENASVRRAEDIARRIKSQLEQEGQQEYRKFETKALYHEELDKIRDEMISSLGEKSKVKLVQTHRQTKITILLNGNPDEVKQRLDRIYTGIVKSSTNQ